MRFFGPGHPVVSWEKEHEVIFLMTLTWTNVDVDMAADWL